MRVESKKSTRTRRRKVMPHKWTVSLYGGTALIVIVVTWKCTKISKYKMWVEKCPMHLLCPRVYSMQMKHEERRKERCNDFTRYCTGDTRERAEWTSLSEGTKSCLQIITSNHSRFGFIWKRSWEKFVSEKHSRTFFVHCVFFLYTALASIKMNCAQLKFASEWERACASLYSLVLSCALW